LKKKKLKKIIKKVVNESIKNPDVLKEIEIRVKCKRFFNEIDSAKKYCGILAIRSRTRAIRNSPLLKRGNHYYFKCGLPNLLIDTEVTDRGIFYEGNYYFSPILFFYIGEKVLFNSVTFEVYSKDNIKLGVVSPRCVFF